ncbi:MAG: hypothetical protein ABFS14_00900 [Gemmatimonadota bacterium]
MTTPPGDREYLERLEFSRGHIAPGMEPVEPRPASTIVTARRRSAGFEVLLLKRPDTARFAAGVFVFAGGVVDSADHSDDLVGILPAGFTGLVKAALAAGLRELFEETGFLLSDKQVLAAEADRARRDLLSAATTFAAIVRQMNLSFRNLPVAYIARWVTPEKFSRRYDTHFFLTGAPGNDPDLTGELVDHVWLRPAEAVRRFETGELPLLFPTRRTLEDLSRFGTLEEALAGYAEHEVKAILPKLLVKGESVVPVLPGDPGFEEADS